MGRFQDMTTPAMIAGGVGVADGFLARQDSTAGRTQTQFQQWSFWGEIAGVGGGLLINQQSRTPFQDTLALSLVASSVALLARRGGTMLAQSMEGAAAAPQMVGVGAAQAFKPMLTAGSGVAAQGIRETAAERRARANQGAFV